MSQSRLNPPTYCPSDIPAAADLYHSVTSTLKNAIAYVDAYGGPVVDGSQYSPSDRAINWYVERFYETTTPEQWERIEWMIADICDHLGLSWHGGVLWRADDLPAED